MRKLLATILHNPLFLLYSFPHTCNEICKEEYRDLSGMQCLVRLSLFSYHMENGQYSCLWKQFRRNWSSISYEKYTEYYRTKFIFWVCYWKFSSQANMERRVGICRWAPLHVWCTGAMSKAGRYMEWIYKEANKNENPSAAGIIWLHWFWASVPIHKIELLTLLGVYTLSKNTASLSMNFCLSLYGSSSK